MQRYSASWTSDMLKKSKSSIAESPLPWWLFGTAGLVATTLTVGAAARLTRTGASTLYWKPKFMHSPMTESEWHDEFDVYRDFCARSQRTPMRKIPIPAQAPLALVAGLGATQLYLGREMVEKNVKTKRGGGDEAPMFEGATFFLPIHSALSLANFSLLIWTGLGIVSPVPRAITVRGLMTPGVLKEMGEVRKHFVALTGLVAGTIFAGSLVAEIDGGREFQTFPKMGKHWIPHGLFEQKPWLRNFHDNVALVQFDHRLLALVTLAAYTTVYMKARKPSIWTNLPEDAKRAMTLAFAAAGGQTLDELKSTSKAHVKVCCVVGFPLGAATTATKAFEAQQCLDAGAEEIDMVINVGMLHAEEYDFVLRDICAVVAVCKERGAISKVILETALLTTEQIRKASELAIAAGADFIKTSTGFSTRAKPDCAAHYSFRRLTHTMFTGIIEEIGTVVSMQERDDLLLWNGERGTGFELVVRVQVALEGAYLGCSIAVNGTCLTATSIDADRVAFGVAPETLRRTNLGQLQPGDKVNVERSMGVDARNSGHFVQGHVDGTGAILSFTREDDSLWVRISATPEILRDIVTKGYIAIDGTSLTVCEVDRTNGWFSIMLISHTQNHIILPLKKVGDLVNLEPDVLGKYAARSMGGVMERVDALEKQLQTTKLATAGLAVVAAALAAALVARK
ncbi:unnamed protein product [Phytophthora lilii]|uniref:Riboflavin synthase n=1 Tax=Phytophthora lilii TaxID=2077276 RepID=A0A9W6TCK8_9STRA|nr:unnamed protein product [Phytophthora lilii]